MYFPGKNKEFGKINLFYLFWAIKVLTMKYFCLLIFLPGI